MTKRREPGSPRAALDGLFRECRGSYAGAADFLDKSEFHLRKCADGEDPRDLGFRAVSQLTAWSKGAAAAEHLAAQAGGMFVPLPEPGSCDLSKLVGEGIVEAADAVRSLLAAEADGSPGGRAKTAEELRELIRQFREVLLPFGRACALAERELAGIEGSASLRSVGGR